MVKKIKDMSFEERMQRLQAIVGCLESGGKPLEESVALFKEGLEHTQVCREQLARARHDIEVCSNGLVTPFTQEFENGDEA